MLLFLMQFSKIQSNIFVLCLGVCIRQSPIKYIPLFWVFGTQGLQYRALVTQMVEEPRLLGGYSEHSRNCQQQEAAADPQAGGEKTGIQDPGYLVREGTHLEL